MIQRLFIQNYALIDNLEVDFSDGFIVLSGETGSGKSIILDAISLIMGKRSDRSSLFNKDKKCILEAEMKLDKHSISLFEQFNLDYEENTIVRREINPSGKSRSFINDTPVPLSTLNTVLSSYIQIYSQHQSISIRSEEKQLELVDKLSGSNSYLTRYQDIFYKYNALVSEIENIKQSSQLSDSEINFLRYQVEEIESSNLIEGEKENLESDLRLLENATDLLETLSQSSQLLSEEEGIIDNIIKIENKFDKIGKISEKIEDINHRLSSVRIELDDITSEIDNIQTQVDVDPKKINQYVHRLDHINSLLSKHRKSKVIDVLELLEEMKLKLAASSDFDRVIKEKEKAISALEGELSVLANDLTKNRMKIIPKFKQDIELNLKRLGIEDPVFDIVFSSKEQYTHQGRDIVLFMFSANKGSEAEEMNKVASGGELSRLMLCFSYLVSEVDNLSCIIFDEIDTGVSGKVADLMSEMMKNMSEEKQIISVTHLPQIASKADAHFKVYKTTRDNRTISEIKNLIIDERVEEIAKMLSGKRVTEVAVNNAKQLLNR